MINMTNIGIRQMLLASALVIAASGVASAQTTKDVTSREGAMTSFFAAIATAPVPYYAGNAGSNLSVSVVGTTSPRGQFAANQHVCVNWMLTQGGKQFVNIELSGGGSVYAAYSTESFIPDPANTPQCAEAHQQYIQEVSTQLIEKLRQDSEQSIRDSAQSTSAGQFTADAVVAKSSPGTSAQSPEQMPSVATQSGSQAPTAASSADTAGTVDGANDPSMRADIADISEFLLSQSTNTTAANPKWPQIAQTNYSLIRNDPDAKNVETKAAIADGFYARGFRRKEFNKEWVGDDKEYNDLQRARVWYQMARLQITSDPSGRLQNLPFEFRFGIKVRLDACLAALQRQPERAVAEKKKKEAEASAGGTRADAGSLEAGLAAEKRGDWKAALSSLKPLAEQGNPRAQARLGYMYDNGEGVTKDNAEAMKWYLKATDQFRKAADQGNADGQYHLGNMYLYGEGVPKDYAEAMKWYLKAADQGDADAQTGLGVMYENGEGVPKDYAEAINWFRKAADQGNSDGQSNVGNMYENGEGVPQDNLKAVQWYRKSAAQGNAEAQVLLGTLLMNILDKKSLAGAFGGGGGGIGEIFDRLFSSEKDISLEEQHYAEVMKWYRMSADQGNVGGQNQLGVMYQEGRVGVPKDYAEAVKWYRKSADQGYATGQYNMGHMYELGDGVPRDYSEALNWYKKAADQGFVEAQKSFALLTKYRPMLEAKKDVADTVCYPSNCTDSFCAIYGQVENVHDDKIEVRVHVPGSGYIGPYGGTVSAAYDKLEWINYNEVIECSR